LFLATTALEEFWDKNQKIVFLGEWCKLYNRKDEWDKLAHETLPYHWDDRKRLYGDYLYLNDVYEKVLAQLCITLNKFHNENHTIRYWRIILGPWLYGFIEILYDRYLSICSAETSGKVTGTITARYDEGQWTPKNTGEFNEWFKDDTYNHYLYSRVIELASSLNYERKDIRNDCKHEDRPEHTSLLLKTIIKKILRTYTKIVPDYFNRIVFVTSYFDRNDLALLQLSLRQFPYLYYPEIEMSAPKVDFQKRKEICINDTNDEFLGLLNSLIPEQIPKCYMESYGLLKKKALHEFPSKPHIIFTANAHHSNEGFKVWAASCIEEGALFIGTQHGGFEGIGLWFPHEDHQINIWDRYYSWGWKDASKESIKPFPSVKLNTVKKIRPDKNGRILMVNTGFLRYSYYMQSMPVASSGCETYLQGIFKFIHSLGEGPQKLLTVRLYPHDYQNCERERFEQECPDIECYLGKNSMYKQLQESRLFIGNANGTTYLEAFVANIPSLIFWNPDHWEIRASAQPYFDKLRSVGIFHDTQESAAELVNKIYSDPIAWWQQPQIQEAKDQVCHQFARTSERWLKEWKEELLGLELKWRK